MIAKTDRMNKVIAFQVQKLHCIYGIAQGVQTNHGNWFH